MHFQAFQIILCVKQIIFNYFICIPGVKTQVRKQKARIPLLYCSTVWKMNLDGWIDNFLPNSWINYKNIAVKLGRCYCRFCNIASHDLTYCLNIKKNPWKSIFYVESCLQSSSYSKEFSGKIFAFHRSLTEHWRCNCQHM